MNFYEAEMRKMFGGNELLTDMKFVGKTMLGKLDDNKLVKLQFLHLQMGAIIKSTYPFAQDLMRQCEV